MTSVRLVAFDLDDTLAESKSPLSFQMGQALADLLDVTQVCVISGGQFSQFDAQVLAHLPGRADLTKLHLMPTCGTRYLRFCPEKGWVEVYAHNMSDDEKSRAINAVEMLAHQLGLWEDQHWGPRIEDRGSQITFSALGQEAPVAAKKAWDPDGSRREALRECVAAELGDLEIRAGGSTSVDITRRGIDKAYGMRELAAQTGIELDEMLFVGDRLVPGGNDYPVKELGVPVHAVAGPDETLEFITELVPTLASRACPSEPSAMLESQSDSVNQGAELHEGSCPEPSAEK